MIKKPFSIKLTGKLVLLFLMLFIIAPTAFAQMDKVDSLKLLLKNARHDSVRCAFLFKLTEEADEEEWPKYNDQLKEICEKNLQKLPSGTSEYLFYKGYYSDVLNNLGYLNNENGNTEDALKYYNKSLKISQELGNKEGEATLLNNLGAIYNFQGSISRAIEYFSKSLKIREQAGDQRGIANSLNNIGIIYNTQGDIIKALEYYRKALAIREKIGDKEGTSILFNNIGIIYDRQGNTAKALEYYNKSLAIKEEMNDKRGIATSLNNIGKIYIQQNNTEKGLEYLNRALSIRESIEDKNGVAYSLYNIGNAWFKKKNYPQALSYAQRSVKIARELGFPESISNAASLLNEIYRATGDFKNALKNYDLYILMRDSVRNAENQKAGIKRELQYNYDKKTAADSVVNAKQLEVHNAQVQKQAAELKAKRNQQYALYGGLALVLVFAGFMYNRFKVTSRQKDIIELKEKETQHQKHIIEEKHKEITDSINYAERIQRSFLASNELLDDNLKDYFVLFKPKDVVSGDFYWSSKLAGSNGAENFALVTADSTGHGVPGAIMSLLNITSLESAIKDGFRDPASILNETRKTIIERLKKDGSTEGGKDGMDCSLCIFDFKNKTLKIAAANNPVWIVRSLSPFEGGSRRAEDVEVLEIKPDKMPVGKHDKQDVSFLTQEIQLQAGDVVYTLTDGFPDQFGGEKSKKFLSKNLRSLLVANAHLPMQQQKESLELTFKNWIGNLEQIDDVTIIGIRI